MLTTVSFIITLGILIAVHEYGHFQMAKWCGVKVLKFSIGFGKPLLRKKIGKDQTEFIIAAIPLGGYVKMLDENELKLEANQNTIDTPTLSETELKRAFNRQSVIKRMAIVLAGPFANLLLAIILYSVLFMMGVVALRPIVGKVTDHSPAALAAFSQGETIQKINGKALSTWQEARWLLLEASLENNNVEIQTLDRNQQVHLRQLNLSELNDENKQDILATLGLTLFQPDIPARIGEVVKNSPADLAGLQTNDLVLMVNHRQVINWQAFVQEIRLNANVPLDVSVQRGSKEVKLIVRPEPVIENHKTVGRIGAAFKVSQSQLDQLFITTHYSMVESIVKASEKTWDTSVFSLKMLGNVIMGKASLKSMSGPVTIASYAGQSAGLGIKAFISFLALISISIGVLNLLPIPVLDGGHFMYYVVEMVIRKPVPESVMIIGQKIGLSLLGFMMIIAFYNDINRLITG